MAKVNKTLRILALVATLLSLPALADASDTKTFTVTVTGAESVTIDTGTAPLTVSYSDTTYCSAVDRFCAWYPTIIYSTNYATNRQLVATATVSDPILSVELAKQSAYPNPFAPDWGPGGSQPGVWGDDFGGSTVTLNSTAKQIVKNIQNGFYAIAPILRLRFSSSPSVGTYSATVTFTIMAQ
ncbi:MAG: hypothetical protein RQ912_08245 [Thermus sp.]|nr:hypothetical protein [Thermus sp.]